MSKLSVEEIHKQNIGKVSDKWSSYLPVYDELLFSLKQMPSFIKEGWIESIEFRNSMIIIGKSTINNNNKLGNRIITVEDA